MTFISVVRALFDYEAKADDELGFGEGDVLCVISQDDEDASWLNGCRLLEQDKVGLIPNNYVAPLDPIHKVKALYSYEATEDNEVAFEEGEELELLMKLEDGWWLVRKDGRTYGMVPSNYFDAIKTSDKSKEEPEYVDDVKGEVVKWIDTVDVKCAWPGKLVFSKNDKRKGDLIVGEDGVLAFISSDKKMQLFKVDLASVQSYDKKKKEIILKDSLERFHVELSKPHIEHLQKEIKLAHERAEREALEWERAQMAEYVQLEKAAAELAEPAPELPARSPTISSTPHQPSSPLAAILTGKQSPVPSNKSADGNTLVTALYDYEPIEDDELKINEEEQLLLIDDSSEDWWLVQRLSGSKRKGLVPSSYLKRHGAHQEQLCASEQEAVVEEEETGLIQPRSPLSPSNGSRPGSPSLAFLDEIKQKLKARSPVAQEPEAAAVIQDDDAAEEEEVRVQSQVEEIDEYYHQDATEPEENCEEIEEEREEIEEEHAKVPTEETPAIPPPPPPMPAFLRSGSIAEEKELNEENVIKKDVVYSPPMPVQSTEKKETRKFEPVSIRTPAASKDVEVVKAEAKKVEPTVTLQIPKLKPVLKDDKGLNALSSMLMRKQEDIRVGQVRVPEVPKPAAVVEEKPNPWKNISVKPAVQKEAIVSVRAQPTANNPPVAQPMPAETRLWTSRNGQYQVEAKYVGYQAGKVSLHKLNGSKVSVALESLCERDKEFVYRREGIPWDQGPKRDFKVGNLDWLAFFMDAGLDPSAARKHAQSCLDKRLSEAFLLSPSFNRDYLLSILTMSEADVLEVLRFTASYRSKHAGEAVVKKSLEKIEALKKEIAGSRSVAPAAPLQRRATEVFAELDQQLFTAAPLKPMPATTTIATGKSIKDIPAMQPIPRSGSQPTVFNSTTVTSIPPNPLAQYLSPIQTQPQTQMFQQHTQMVHPMVQQPIGLPNLNNQQRPYVPIQAQPTQQRFHQVQQHPVVLQQQPSLQQQQAFPVLNTTQVRTEYYGFNGQSTPMGQYQPPQQYANPQQAALAGLQNLHLQPPTASAQAANPAVQPVGDKYSIFRYVDPASPQLLPPPQPGSSGNSNTHGGGQQPNWQQRP